MTQGIDNIERRLAALRKDFDEAFASPPPEARPGEVEFLRITAGGQFFAIRIAGLAGLEADLKIVPLPVASPGLLGLGAIRGQLVAVFDLAAILGAGGRTQPPRWTALVRDRELIALAFDGFQGSCRVHEQDVHSLELAPEKVHLTRQAIGVDGRWIHVVDLAAVIASIRKAIRP